MSLKRNIDMIVFIPFNSFGFTEERFTKEWIDQRLSVFMNYTLKSLKAQTNQNFLALAIYNIRSTDLIKEALSKYEPLPKNIQFVNPKEYHQAIKKSMQGQDYLYLARLDSDDMYHKSYIQNLYEYEPRREETKVLISQQGYIYDSINHKIAKYYHYSPQFYVLTYQTQNYINGERIKSGGGHGDMIKLPHEIINDRNYINHVHSNNVSLNNIRTLSDPLKNYIGEIINDKKVIDEILKDYM